MTAPRTALIATLALAAAAPALSQPPAAIPQYPPGPGFAGVFGTPEEAARITALCGPNRNATDGYAPPPAFPGQTKAPIVRGSQAFAVQTVAKIDRPFGMDFLPNGHMLVTFRNGGMRIVTPEGAVSDLLAGVPEMVNPRLGSGLYDVIADRDFARNRTIYFTFHTKFAADAKAMGRIARAKLSPDEKSLTDVKVLRINADGSIPKDNPFRADPKADPAVWALGFRDIHAATIHPATGELWAAENQPRGGDRLEAIRAGRNYGMPVISYGRQNSGALINGGKTAQAGIEQPLYYWNPSIAPSGIAVYTGKAFPAWKGDVFVGAMSGQQLIRLKMKGERVVAEEKLLMDRCERIKVVKQGPDGAIYVVTDDSAGELWKLVPRK
jgi:glucose/arabinose dehydrogenase